MKLTVRHNDKECTYCGKQKKTVTVELENGRQTQLCWKDLEKMSEVMLPEAERADRPASR